MKRINSRSGFSLIEVLITIAIFGIIASGVYLSYSNLIDVIGRTRTHTLATSLIETQVEMVRNLPYDSVGIAGGYPVGVLPATTTIAYEGQQFVINYYVRNFDDAFDRLASSTPGDTAPADYKLVELQVDCPTCFNFVPVVFTTWVAPQNLESSTKNGSLFVNVFDANGQGIANAAVLVKNTSTTPSITINDTTNNSGSLQLVDIPTSTSAYQITVSKSGYTTGKTYPLGAPGNPNPTAPHATVASQQITAVSFAIDRVSTINAFAHDQFCQGVPSVAMTQTGQKLIGANPNVPLYSQSFTTGSDGVSARTGLSWDTYAFTNTSSQYDLAGSIPLLPVTIAPNTTTDVGFLVEPKSTSALLVTVTDSAGAPLPDTLVTISKTGFTDTKLTGEKSFTQTDWSGGQYSSQDGSVADASPAGELNIATINSAYATNTNSFVESNTVNFGTSTVSLHGLSWTPVSQSSGATLKFQLAAAGDSSGPWSYTGPDGTGSTYYTATSTLSTQYDGKQYVRYKAFLNTTSESVTPRLTDVEMTFTSGCIPSAQAFWPGIATGAYTVTAVKTGYQDATGSITVGSGWQELRLMMQ